MVRVRFGVLAARALPTTQMSSGAKAAAARRSLVGRSPVGLAAARQSDGQPGVLVDGSVCVGRGSGVRTTGLPAGRSNVRAATGVSVGGGGGGAGGRKVIWLPTRSRRSTP